MSTTTKKYLQGRDDDHPSFGNFAHWFIKQQNVLKKDVAKDLGIIPTTVNQYFKQHSFQFGILWRISRAINYNMVMDLGERLDIDYETKKERELKAQLLEKEKQIEVLNMQLDLFKKIHKIE